MKKSTNARDGVSDETGLFPWQKEELRAALLAQRAELIAKFDEHVGSAIADTASLADEMDLATRDQEQAYLLRLADKERKLLREIHDALRRIDAGSYGLCEGTGEPIGMRRLRARPWARYSVEYKEMLEREENAHVRR